MAYIIFPLFVLCLKRSGKGNRGNYLFPGLFPSYSGREKLTPPAVTED